jgi:hypothetical protein
VVIHCLQNYNLGARTAAHGFTDLEKKYVFAYFNIYFSLSISDLKFGRTI